MCGKRARMFGGAAGNERLDRQSPHLNSAKQLTSAGASDRADEPTGLLAQSFIKRRNNVCFQLRRDNVVEVEPDR